MQQVTPTEHQATAPPAETTLYLYGLFDGEQYNEEATWAFCSRADRDLFHLHHMAKLYHITLTGDGDDDWERIREEAEVTNDRLQTWTADLPYPTAITLAEALACLQQDAPT
jgi:hypothetical protein